MKLTTRAATELLTALAALNGQPRAVNVNGQQGVIIEPFSFTAQTRAALARNIARLNVLAAAHEHARSMFSAQPDFAAVCTLLDADEHEITLNEISEADLQLHQNAIQPTALAALMPIVKDWREESPVIDFASLKGTCAREGQREQTPEGTV